MKKLTLLATLIVLVSVGAPANAFFDYLFGGSSNKGAIDNSAMGDLRAWWSGNPAYQFNPFYSGNSPVPGTQDPQSSGFSPTYAQPPNAGMPQQAPQAQYYPQPGPQGAYPGQQYSQPQASYGAPSPGYQQYGPPSQAGSYPPPGQPYPMPPQGGQYQPAPQAYPVSQAPQYQQMPQQQYQVPQGQYPGAPPAADLGATQTYQGTPIYGGAGFVPGYGYVQQ